MGLCHDNQLLQMEDFLLFYSPKPPYHPQNSCDVLTSTILVWLMMKFGMEVTFGELPLTMNTRGITSMFSPPQLPTLPPRNHPNNQLKFGSVLLILLLRFETAAVITPSLPWTWIRLNQKTFYSRTETDPALNRLGNWGKKSNFNLMSPFLPSHFCLGTS